MEPASLVFESVGIPAFHLTWLRPALFATELWTDRRKSVAPQNYGMSAGRPICASASCTGTT
jgi:hypothetical protein